MLSKGSRRRTRVCAYTVYSPGRVLIVKILAVVVGCPPVCVFVFFVLGAAAQPQGEGASYKRLNSHVRSLKKKDV